MALNQQNLDRLKIDNSSRLSSRSGGSSWLKWLVLGLLLLAGIGGGAWYGARRSVEEVRTATVLVESASSGQPGARTVLNASGYVTPRRTATVSSKVTGTVVEVLVEEGMRVQTNQVLARLDDSNLMANKKLAEAQLASAQIAVRETEALFDEAKSRFNRVSNLVKANIETASNLEKAEADVKSLRARYERLKLEITVAERALALWDQQLEDVIIRAPFSGVVTAKNAQPGEVISPMSSGGFTRTGVCTIVDMESLEIEVDVNESFLNRVKPGQKVEASLDAYPDWKIPCHVIAIIPTADRQKATVKVRVGFERLDERILPQMGVKVAFRAEDQPEGSSSGEVPVARKPALLVPKNAIQTRDGKSIVWVLRGEEVERRAVTVDKTVSGDQWIVLGGLKAGEKVVLDPGPALVDGGRVRIATQTR